MTKKLFIEAMTKFILGVVLVGLLIFLPAGTVSFFNGWLLMGILFVPMFLAGIVMMFKNPDLLKSRLNAKEKQQEQSLVVKLSGLMFLAGFVVAGLGGKAGMTFAELLDAVASIEGDFRVRFMTSHPKDFNEDVVKVMEKHRKICRLVHLPVQSGSNSVLQAMNRRYTREKYLSEIKMLRDRIPEAEVTTDIIVGFPNETEDDYLDTENLVREVDFASAFTFVYSPRQGTKAAEMEGQIPENVQKDRIMRLVELVNSLTRKKSEKYVGKTVEILCEDYDEKKALYLGRDEFGRMGYFKSDKDRIGEFVSLKVTRANGISLFGEIVE